MIQTIITFLIFAWAVYYFFIKMIYPLFNKQDKSFCCDCALNPSNSTDDGADKKGHDINKTIPKQTSEI